MKLFEENERLRARVEALTAERDILKTDLRDVRAERDAMAQAHKTACQFVDAISEQRNVALNQSASLEARNKALREALSEISKDNFLHKSTQIAIKALATDEKETPHG
jgi:hypothetical protein